MGVRRRLPEEPFLPAIPTDPQALQKAVDARETQKILRRIGRLEQRRAEDAIAPAVSRPGGFFARAARRLRRAVRS